MVSFANVGQSQGFYRAQYMHGSPVEVEPFCSHCSSLTVLVKAFRCISHWAFIHLPHTRILVMTSLITVVQFLSTCTCHFKVVKFVQYFVPCAKITFLCYNTDCPFHWIVVFKYCCYPKDWRRSWSRACTTQGTVHVKKNFYHTIIQWYNYTI